jgi:hypothetical protein
LANDRRPIAGHPPTCGKTIREWTGRTTVGSPPTGHQLRVQAMATVQAGHLKRYSKGEETEISRLNQEIEKLSQTERSIFSDVEAFRESVIENADKEREAAEERYDNWTIRFYVLYVLRWVTGVVGLLLGLETETEGREL